MIIKQPLVVDVAYNNVGVNWPVAKLGGVRAGIAKASEGAFIEDSEFKRNWPGMKDAGLPRAAYHFYRWWVSPGGNARKFISTIKKYGGMGPGDKFVLDDEEEGHMSLRSMLDFTYQVESELGVIGIWYSWSWMLNELKMNKLSSSDIEYMIKILQFWGAGYPNNPDLFVSPPKFYTPDQTKFGKMILWQYDSEVPGVQGIPGGTDVNWVDPAFLAQWEKDSQVQPSPIPQPQPPVPGLAYNGVAIAHPYLRVRQGPGTNYPISNGDVIMPGQAVGILMTQFDSKNNLWGKLGDNRWVAVSYEGQVYVQHKS